MTTQPPVAASLAERDELRRLAELARVRSVELDKTAGSARVAGDDATSRNYADRSSFAWGVSRTLSWLAGEEPGDWLPDVLADSDRKDPVR